MDIYLIVRIGTHGIDDILFPTTAVNDVLEKIIELRESMSKNHINPNLLCVRMWDGINFKCRCNQIGIKQMKEFEPVNHEKD